MDFLNTSIARFSKLHLREQLLVVVLAMILMYLIVDIALLQPQDTKLKNLLRSDKAHQTELAAITKTIATIEQETTKGLDPLAKDRAALHSLKKQIADADEFFGKTNASTEGASAQLGMLVKELLDNSPGVALESFKTLPVKEFRPPELDLDKSKTNPADKTAKETSGSPELAKVKRQFSNMA